MADMQFQALNVAAVQAETDKAIKISFRVPDELRDAFTYQQGQYLTLESDIDGESIRRSYSICSGVNDELMQIAIKRVEDGVFSNYANGSTTCSNSWSSAQIRPRSFPTTIRTRIRSVIR